MHTSTNITGIKEISKFNLTLESEGFTVTVVVAAVAVEWSIPMKKNTVSSGEDDGLYSIMV